VLMNKSRCVVRLNRAEPHMQCPVQLILQCNAQLDTPPFRSRLSSMCGFDNFRKP
jgi:hypothetical protein